MNQASINSLTTLVRSRLNLTNLNTITDAEIKTFVRSSMAQLYEIICNKHRDYYVSIQKLSLAANVDKYPLPSDFRTVVQVYLTSGNAPNLVRVPLRQFNLNEFQNLPPNLYLSPQWPSMYRVMGREIWFTPLPTESFANAIDLLYIPQFQGSVNDDLPIDTVLPNGWERWVEFDACVQVAMRMRLAEYYAMYSKERDIIEARVVRAAVIRDEQPQYMTDVFAEQGYFGFNRPGTF